MDNIADKIKAMILNIRYDVNRQSGYGDSFDSMKRAIEGSPEDIAYNIWDSISVTVTNKWLSG